VAGLKRYAGHPLFVYAAFATWFRHYDASRPHFAVHHADGTVIDDGYFGLCLNTSPYTYLGNRPLDIAPEATLDSPLTMFTVRSLAFTNIIRVALSALGSGRYLRSTRHVDLRTGSRRSGRGLRALPLPGRRRLPGHHRAARAAPRTRRARPRHAVGS
jgi:hypothetical protein